MKHRNFLNLVMGIGLGVALGVSALAGGADAAPVTPTPLTTAMPAAASTDLRPATTSADEVARLKPTEVRWGHHWHRHGHWHHRHFGWHRHGGWHRHHWHHHHWHHHHFHRHW